MTTLSELFPVGGGGNAEDFVASGALPNGKPVILKANGQVEVVAGSDGATGNKTVFEAATTRYVSSAYDTNTNRVVIAYADNGNSSYGTAIVGTVSGTGISFGSAVVFESAEVQDVSVTFDSNSNKIVIAYADEGNSSHGTAIVGTVSGTAISFGSAVVFESANTGQIEATFDNNLNKVVIVYTDNANSSFGTAIVGTVSGTGISFGGAAVFESAAIGGLKVSFDSSSNKIIIVYQDQGNSNYGTAIIGTVSGTSISFGTAVVFLAANNQDNGVPIIDTNNNKVIISFKDAGNSGYGTSRVGTVSGTGISFGTAVVFNSGNTHLATGQSYHPNLQRAVIGYRDDGDSNIGKYVVGAVSGTSISFKSEINFSTGRADNLSLIYDPDSANLIMSFEDFANSNRGTSLVFSPTVKNLTETNFLGTATAAYTNGQTASIMLKGGISDNQTSLAIGSTYYVQTNGTFATSAGTPSVLAGKAVSATSLLLNGLDDLQDGGATSINGLTDGYNDNSSLGLGTNALANDDGSANLSTAVGTSAMTANTTGYHNAAIGSFALAANTTGYRHVSVGAYSLYFNTTSDSNTASGYKSMFDTTTGSNNAATGTSSLENNTTGNRNTANGYDSLKTNTTGSNNAAYGMNSLLRNATGSSNTASGYRALENNTTANANTASGMYALAGNTTGTNNTGVGHSANGPSGTQSNTITLGDANVSVLRCNDTSISGLSDRRDKTNITNLPESAGLGIINALRPVTFNWDRREWYDNNTPDGSKIMLDWRRWKAHSGLKYGFIAQEVQATIADEKCMADSNIVSDENLDRIEFAPQHLLTNAIKAIQQLSTENEALKIRLTALENA